MQGTRVQRVGGTMGEILMDLVENICDNFCKYSGTGTSEDGCEYCRTHNGECPLDVITREIEEKSDEVFKR